MLEGFENKRNFSFFQRVLIEFKKYDLEALTAWQCSPHNFTNSKTQILTY